MGPPSPTTTTTSKAEQPKQASAQESKKPLAETKWPCANCHALVKATDDRCPTCHGIQVKIKGSPAKEQWVERVSPVSVPRATPFQEEEEEHKEIDVVEVEDDDLEVSVATPDHVSEDGDENRPHNPVAATLAAAPSPAVGKEAPSSTNIQVSSSSSPENEGKLKRKASTEELNKESKIPKTIVESEEALDS